MRYFPSAVRQRVTVVTVSGVAGLLTLGLLTVPLANADNGSGDLKHRHAQVQGQIAAASSGLDDASHEIVRATAAVTAARARLQTARTHLGDVHTRLTAAQAQAARLRTALAASQGRLAAAQAALAAGQQAVDTQQGQVRDRVVSSYTYGDLRLHALGSLMGAASLGDLADRVALENVVVDRSSQALDDLVVAERDLALKQDEVAAATRAVASRTRQAAAQVTSVQALYGEARTAEHSVAALVAQNVRARQHALTVRRRDRGTLARLRSREAGIKRQILALAAKEKGGYTGTSSGFLTYPAAGYPVTSPYGYRVNPIYGYYGLHNGDDFGVPCGTQLRAVASGTIIDEYYDSVWGNRIFLNLGQVNGHNMTVIYNHMSKFFSANGEHVARGQVIGLSGTTGWSTGCHLHFTVMVDGVAVDPMRFL